MTLSEVEIIQLELKKLKKVCEQLRLDLDGIQLALPSEVTPIVDALIQNENKDKGVSLIY